jgi:hypothetical protein
LHERLGRIKRNRVEAVVAGARERDGSHSSAALGGPALRGPVHLHAGSRAHAEKWAWHMGKDTLRGPGGRALRLEQAGRSAAVGVTQNPGRSTQNTANERVHTRCSHLASPPARASKPGALVWRTVRPSVFSTTLLDAIWGCLPYGHALAKTGQS